MNYTFQVPRTSEGYDFEAHRKLFLDGDEITVGETLKISEFVDGAGTPLVSAMNRKPAMLVLLKFDCAYVRIAGDQMHDVRKRLQQIDVKYIVLAMPAFDPTVWKQGQNSDSGREEHALAEEEFFRRLKVFRLEPGFIWSSHAEETFRLRRLERPSHLLVDRSGRILEIWNGTSLDPVVRERMANQIVADAVAILKSQTLTNTVSPLK